MSCRNGYTTTTPEFAQFPSQPTTTASSRNDPPSEPPTPPDEVDDMEPKMSMWRACHLKAVATVKGNIGLLLITGAQMFFSLMNVAVKRLNAIDPPVTTFEYLSLSDATALTFLAPLCTGIAGAIFLGEKYTIPQALASAWPCLVSSERRVHVRHPPITFKQCALKHFQRCIDNSDRKESASAARDGVVLDTEMVVTKTSFIVPTEIQWLGMLIMIGVFGFLAQIVFATILERIFFKAEPSFLSVTGTLIIVSSALYIAITKQRVQKGKTNVRLSSVPEAALEEGLLDGLEAHAEEENTKNGPDSDESSVPFPNKLKGDDHEIEHALPASQGTTNTTSAASGKSPETR
ncbi:hypothetical protein DXG01_009054 [Tephrocybe rancida]|nr:hypothetical protein DXG01_009054 [Tephrocybe rancida]